ncbi:MAG: DUF2461 domain-containing protein [Chlorobiaceae bacterium]|nr:DUF2461 domain-containing protein [Chlorobiaceae bacterium]
MVTESTLDFLKALKANNSREWFDAHRSDYQNAYGDFFDTVVQFVQSISAFDPAIAEARLDPKSCIMRIYRDIRFSKDKTPYKTGFFAYVSKGGRKGALAGYYLHIEPGSSFSGGGLYMPEPPALEKTRHALDTRFPEWQSIVSNTELIDRFPEGVQPSGATKRPPKGYDDKNPAIEYLKFKGYYTQKFFSDQESVAPDFMTSLSDSSRSVKPLVDFLNDALTGL